MSTHQSKFGRRYDEEFKREVAALAARPEAKDEQVARDLGVSVHSVARWRRRYGPPPAAASIAAATPGAAVSVHAASREELEREVRALRREVAEVRQQREILKKALAIFPAPPR